MSNFEESYRKPWCDKRGCGCMEHPPGERDGTTGTYRSDGYPDRRGGYRYPGPPDPVE